MFILLSHQIIFKHFFLKKGGLFPHGHPHTATFPARPPYTPARYRGLALSPCLGNRDWGLGNLPFAMCAYYFHDQIATRKIVVSIRSVKVLRSDYKQQIPRSLIPIPQSFYNNNCVEFGAAKLRIYPAKPDSRGIAQDAERLERKGGHDKCCGVPEKARKVSPLFLESYWKHWFWVFIFLVFRAMLSCPEAEV